MTLRRLPGFTYLRPSTVGEAVQALAEHGSEAQILAGGTDLLVWMKERRCAPQWLLSLSGVAGLNGISYEEGRGLRIGALTTHDALAAHPLVKGRYRGLAQACRRMGSAQVRNRGTIGGNVCNASPSADTAPVLLAMNARLQLASPKGERTVPIDEFFTGPFSTVLETAEVLTTIDLPDIPAEADSTYQWVSKVTVVDETLASVAAVASINRSNGTTTCSEVRLGLGGVGPAPFRARKAEAVLQGQPVSAELIARAAVEAVSEARPRSRAEYRQAMVEVLVRRALGEVFGIARLNEGKAV